MTEEKTVEQKWKRLRQQDRIKLTTFACFLYKPNPCPLQYAALDQYMDEKNIGLDDIPQNVLNNARRQYE